MAKRNIDTATPYTVHAVLAGAYAGRGIEQTLLYHASQDDSETALCKKVKQYNLCDLIEDAHIQPTCPVCIKRIAVRGLKRAEKKAT